MKKLFAVICLLSLVGCKEYSCDQLNELKALHKENAPKAEQMFNQCVINAKTEHDDVDSQTVAVCRNTADNIYPTYDWAFKKQCRNQ